MLAAMLVACHRRCRRCRLVVLCLCVAVAVWLVRCVTVGPSPAVWDGATLRRLMSGRLSPGGALWRTAAGDRLTFFHLPSRRSQQSFTELTSANPDTALPLAPDFTFHLRYANDSLVIYEDQGAGCILRIFLLPILPTDFSLLRAMTARNMSRPLLRVDIDGRPFTFTMRALMEADRAPFIQPISTRPRWAMSGVGAYTPLCYQHNATMTYVHDAALPPRLLQAMHDCSSGALWCPVRLYSAVSRLRFAAGTRVESYAGSWRGHDAGVGRAAALLSHPLVLGPHPHCLLRCVTLRPGDAHMAFSRDVSGVISALYIRVVDALTLRPPADWSQLHLVVQLDGEVQMNVSLGALFMASVSADNDFAGAFLGRLPRACRFTAPSPLPVSAPTAYLHLPMPFWRRARLSLRHVGGHESRSLLACYQVHSVQNWYARRSTGQLRAVRTCYAGSAGWRDMLTVRGAWGHVVAVLTEVDRLTPDPGSVSGRWAALQADTVLYVDGARSATMAGTGVEDYFSYAHGFARADNTSYAFVGLPYAAPDTGPHAPRTWHCYRLHLLDPIPFQRSIQLVTEGVGDRFQRPQPPTDCRTPPHDAPAFNYLVLFYARSLGGATGRDDTLSLGDRRSEQRHRFRSDGRCGALFSVRSKRYLAAVSENRTYDRTGRTFCAGSRLRFTLALYGARDLGASLRRQSYTPPGRWNEEARVWVGGRYRGRWLVPKGALSDEYSLREEDFLVGREDTVSRTLVTFEIEPLTEWTDISYTLLATA